MFNLFKHPHQQQNLHPQQQGFHNPESNQAVVYTQTPLGLQGVPIVGNRDTQPLESFQYGWLKLIALPSSISGIMLDAFIWLFASNVTFNLLGLALTNLGGLVGIAFVMPIAVVLLGLASTAWFSKSSLLKAMAVIRLILILAGILL